MGISGTATPGAHLSGASLTDTADQATVATTTATVTVTAVPTLGLATSGTPARAEVGTAYTLTLSPSVTGTTYHDPQLVATLPSGETFSADPSPSGWSCSLSGGTATLTCTATTPATLPAVTAGVSISADATTGTDTTTASLTDSADHAASVTRTATVSVTDTPVLALTTSGTPTRAEVGTDYTLTLDPSISGTAYHDPQLTVSLPAGETFSADPSASGWSCSLSGGTATLTCTATTPATLPAITATVDIAGSAAPGTDTTTATLTDGGDSAAPVTRSPQVTVTAVPGLSLTTEGTPSRAEAGTDYTLTLFSSVTGTAYHDPQLTVSLPAGETFSADPSASGWSCSLSGGTATLTCTAATPSPSGPVTAEVHIADDATPGTAWTTATLSDAGDRATPSTTAANVTVTPAPPTQLVYNSVPTALSAGQSFGVTVWVENTYDNLVTSGPGATDAISVTAPSLSCTGGLTATASGGVATFSGCSLTAAGTATVVATDTTVGDTGVYPATATVGVTPAGAAELAFVSPPASTTAGTAVPLTVDVEDHYGNKVTSGTGATDTIAVTGATCTPPTVAAVGGVAAFTGCLLPTAAGPHDVTATDTTPGDTGFLAATATIAVSAGSASKLAFTAPPTSITVGEPFSLTVQVVDTDGNPILTGTGSTDSITVSGGSLSCLGGTTARATAGSATFSGCTLATPPSATLTAADVTEGDTGFTPASTVVDVDQAQTTTTLTPSSDPGTLGTPVTYRAAVVATRPSRGAPGGDVEFEVGGQAISGCTARPLSGGAATCAVTYELLTMQTVIAVYLGSPGYATSTSPTVTENLIGSGLVMSESTSGANPNSTTVDLAPVALNGTATERSSTGTLNTVHIADNRGTSAGWTVTAQLGGNFFNLSPSGDPIDNVIPASDLLWSPQVGTGSAAGVVAGPAGALSKTVARTLCSAAPGHGAGQSTCGATFRLAIPPQVAAGRYETVVDIIVS